MRILGVDPGTRRTGVGIVESDANQYQLLHFEILSIQDSLTRPEKLLFIYRSLREIIQKFQPDVLALENIFYGKDIQAMVKVGEARACVILAASEQGVPVVEYSPARVKQSISGNGRATKEQVQHMIKALLNMKTAPPADGADALAVAICHFHSKNNRIDFFKKAEKSKDVSFSYRTIG